MLENMIIGQEYSGERMGKNKIVLFRKLRQSESFAFAILSGATLGVDFI